MHIYLNATEIHIFSFVQNQALQANKQMKGIEHMMEQLKEANDQLRVVKEAFMTHKKQEVMYRCFYPENKKVLLCDRKKLTARGVTALALLSVGGRIGGTNCPGRGAAPVLAGTFRHGTRDQGVPLPPERTLDQRPGGTIWKGPWTKGQAAGGTPFAVTQEDCLVELIFSLNLEHRLKIACCAALSGILAQNSWKRFRSLLLFQLCSLNICWITITLLTGNKVPVIVPTLHETLA